MTKESILKLKIDFINSIEKEMDENISVLISLLDEIQKSKEQGRNLSLENSKLLINNNALKSDNKIEVELYRKLSTVSESIKAKTNELQTLESEKTTLVNSIEQTKVLAKIELDSITQEINKQKSIILPTTRELRQREETLAVREGDLEIIIDRYKKLYAEIGKNFSI